MVIARCLYVPDKRRHIAELLLEYESEAGKLGNETAAFRVSEKLRHPLTALLGELGFRALLGRALLLAQADAPELSSVAVATDGSLKGLSKGRRHRANGDVTLIAKLLALLDTFVGEAVMLRVVQGAWPQATLDELKKRKTRGEGK